jgi:hypothetical protein
VRISEKTVFSGRSRRKRRVNVICWQKHSGAIACGKGEDHPSPAVKFALTGGPSHVWAASTCCHVVTPDIHVVALPRFV